ncbi:MAG: hypothetical protein HZB10_03690 [Candidatus Yonathbacteria bacterium]|nr:hypothetical protein [Candidatus Yonathbacteria bacterium]
MEKEYRKVKCPGSTVQRCGAILRLKISAKHYGKQVTVTCPKCGVKFQTRIPTPAELAKKCVDAMDDLFGMDALDELFGRPKR